uniref:Uncharacterized protein n=1 Tax=Cucumis melo TaxID=3656 RepID=A0A9I9EGK9_CUCME
MKTSRCRDDTFLRRQQICEQFRKFQHILSYNQWRSYNQLSLSDPPWRRMKFSSHHNPLLYELGLDSILHRTVRVSRKESDRTQSEVSSSQSASIYEKTQVS